jgi:serine/threonine-protein kinase RsbW
LSSMGREDKGSFRRSVDALGDIFDFVAKFVDRENLDSKTDFTLKFIIEELFTNMVKYNVDGTQDIDIQIRHESPLLILEIVDFDVDAFDPESLKDVDVNQPIEDRLPGGLGLHLVKSMVDDVNFEHRDQNMRITVTKNLER